MLSYHAIAEVAALGAATASVSVTVALTHVFAPVRKFFLKRVPPIGRLLSCFYCTSHWVSAILLLLAGLPVPLRTGSITIDLFVAWMMTVAASTVTVKLMTGGGVGGE